MERGRELPLTGAGISGPLGDSTLSRRSLLREPEVGVLKGSLSGYYLGVEEAGISVL